MEHDINLNIHYSAPDDIWKKIGEVYASMPYWSGNENGPHWEGNDIDIWASVEPSGIHIAGTMPNNIWEKWYSLLNIHRKIPFESYLIIILHINQRKQKNFCLQCLNIDSNLYLHQHMVHG